MITRPEDITPGSTPDVSPAPRHWTVADLLSWTEDYFKRRGIDSARFDAEILLAQAMDTTRLELYTGYHRVVESGERETYRQLVERRARFEPIAYILGVREFYSLEFEVNPEVLIPRPETELLVERVLEEFKSKPVEGIPLILELGTGSGNIAVTLLKHLPAARVVSVDLSRAALEVARRNAERHGVGERLETVEGDLFACLLNRPERFSVVVSNPPYIAAADYPHLMQDVRDHEPEMALVDAKSGDGMGFYRAITVSSLEYLERGGLLAYEVGATQARDVEILLDHHGWEEIQSFADLAGIPRVVTARRK